MWIAKEIGIEGIGIGTLEERSHGVLIDGMRERGTCTGGMMLKSGEEGIERRGTLIGSEGSMTGAEETGPGNQRGAMGETGLAGRLIGLGLQGDRLHLCHGTKEPLEGRDEVSPT